VSRVSPRVDLRVPRERVGSERCDYDEERELRIAMLLFMNMKRTYEESIKVFIKDLKKVSGIQKKTLVPSVEHAVQRVGKTPLSRLRQTPS